MESEQERLLREIESLRHVPPPSPEALAAGRRRFLNEADDLRRRRAARKYTPALRRVLGPIAAALLLLLGALAGTIAAAQGAQPDSPLYPVKLTWEDARLSLAAGPQEQAELALTLAETRVTEMAAMAQTGRPIPAAPLERLHAHLELVLWNAAQLPDAAMQRLLLQVQERLRVQEQTLEQALGQAAGPNREAVRLSMEAAIQTQQWAALGWSDPEAFRQAGSAGFASPPPLPPTATATPRPPFPTPPRPSASPTPTATPTGTATPERPPTPGTPGSSPTPPPATMQPSHTPRPTPTSCPPSPSDTPCSPKGTPGPPENTPGPSVRPGETQGHGPDPTKTPRH